MNKIIPDNIDVSINFINRYGLLGALFACPISKFGETVSLIGNNIKNIIHQRTTKIRKFVNIAIKI